MMNWMIPGALAETVPTEAYAEPVALTAGQSIVSLLFSMAPLLLLLLIIVVAVIVFIRLCKPKAQRAVGAGASVPAAPPAPVQQQNAMVITKRSPSSTEYFVGVELEGGERMELWVSGSQYGLLLEGDQGLLTWQGRRLVSFERAAVARKA